MPEEPTDGEDRPEGEEEEEAEEGHPDPGGQLDASDLRAATPAEILNGIGSRCSILRHGPDRPADPADPVAPPGHAP